MSTEGGEERGEEEGGEERGGMRAMQISQRSIQVLKLHTSTHHILQTLVYSVIMRIVEDDL